jgi:hypothetical protein
VLVVRKHFRKMLFGMAEMLEFMYSERREELLKVNDIINFIYKSFHI